MTPRIPTTKRESWHRKEDRWTWVGFNGRWSSSKMPKWVRIGGHKSPGLVYWEWDTTSANYETGGSSQIHPVRLSSLRRIAPAAKARKAREMVTAWSFVAVHRTERPPRIRVIGVRTKRLANTMRVTFKYSIGRKLSEWRVGPVQRHEWPLPTPKKASKP